MLRTTIPDGLLAASAPSIGTTYAQAICFHLRSRTGLALAGTFAAKTVAQRPLARRLRELLGDLL